MVDEGWVLPDKRNVERFSANALEFLHGLFNEGMERKSKLSPKEAVRQMKEARRDGIKRFDRVFTEQQVASIFSRLAQKQRSQPMTR